MVKIPIRHINTSPNEPHSTEGFSIRTISELLAGKDMVQPLHRHDFFYLLAVKKGMGDHEIDFTRYAICDQAVFFMRPGQTHRLTLKTGSEGYLLVFSKDFYYPHDKAFNQLLRKAGSINFYKVNATRFQKLFAALTNIFQEYTDKQEKYQEGY
jgi:AraC family transcriptional activator of pobA